MEVSELLSQLHGMSESDLLTLNASVVRHLKYARKRNNIIARTSFSVGDLVGFGEHGGRGKRAYKEGTVHAVKRTRAQVKVNGVQWTVPLSMLVTVG
jgi:hypothetical protein